MNWLAVAVETTSKGVDIVTDVLLGCGIGGFEVEDRQDFIEFLEKKQVHWDYVEEELKNKRLAAPTVVRFYVTANEQGRQTLVDVEAALARLRLRDEGDEFPPLALRVEGDLEEESWANSWKRYFKAFAVGERLWIKPSWEEAGDSGGRTVLQIDPGSSFGSGTHSTTRLCLGALERLVKPDYAVLDMGCGSGILSIAAKLLGAGDVTAVDVDGNAAATALENASENGVSIRALSGNVLADEALAKTLRGFDLIAANIVADVVVLMAPFFKEALVDGGTLVVSGILREGRDEVIRVLKAHGLAHLDGEADGDWVSIYFQKGGRFL